MPYIPLPRGFFETTGKEVGSLACFPLKLYALSKFLELMVCGIRGLAQTRNGNNLAKRKYRNFN